MIAKTLINNGVVSKNYCYPRKKVVMLFWPLLVVFFGQNLTKNILGTLYLKNIYHTN